LAFFSACSTKIREICCYDDCPSHDKIKKREEEWKNVVDLHIVRQWAVMGSTKSNDGKAGTRRKERPIYVSTLMVQAHGQQVQADDAAASLRWG
jgi:hypothetical protein